jgi:2'-5' RNA ligase
VNGSPRSRGLRLFFALWPPGRTAAALAQWAAEAAASSGGRAVREPSIHLTLAFLGTVGEERLPAALRAARQVRGSAHELPIEQAKRWSDNDLVWVGPERTPPELASLAEALAGALRGEGFAVESRPFAAHVTLVRRARRAALPPLPGLEWPVIEFTLVHSTLSRHGSSYTILERFPIA